MKENSNVLTLSNSGLSLIPITEGEKRPHAILGGTHDLLTRRATQEEVKKWKEAGVTSWAIAGGTVSGNLVCLDFDEKHYPGLYDLWYDRLSDEQRAVVDTCATSVTRNKGHHIRYRTQTSQPSIKLARRVELNKETHKEEIVTTAETKAEGGYALIPPSAGYALIQGDIEHLPLVTDEMHEELTDILRTFNEIEDEPATEYEQKPGTTVKGDRPGDRLNALMSWKEILEPHGWVQETDNQWRRPGKSAGDGISATTDHAGVPMLYVFSSSAAPFKENKGYSKFHAFALLNHEGDFKAAARAAAELYPEEKDENEDGEEDMGDENDGSQASIVLKNVLNRKGAVLFHDKQGDGYMALDVSGHQEIWACKSKAIKRWVSRETYLLQKKAPSSETVKSVLSVIDGKACFDGPEINLHNRVAWRNGNLWYDLTNESRQSVLINKEGWEVVDQTPIMFKRYSHHQAQQIPIKGGDVKRLLDYINVENPEHKLLLLVSVISSFIPDFSHPMWVIFGVQGSAKSTLSKLVRSIVDPSIMDVVALPSSIKELVQVLAHHHFLFFDNVSYVSEEASDILCKAITGSGFSKRELYSDDDDIIYVLKRCVGVNGINLVTLRPDLLERSLLLELGRIDPVKRKQEQEIYSEFTKDLPHILGGVFDVLVKTLEAKERITVSNLPRMADFTIWGCAIAEALGYTKEVFLTAYRNNIARQSEMLVNENMVASAIVMLMEKGYYSEWNGTATRLLKELSILPIDTAHDKYWPKIPGLLSRKLNEVSPHLRSMGYIVTISTTGEKRSIQIKKVESESPSTDELKNEIKQPSPSDDADDTDDVFGVSTEEVVADDEIGLR